MEGVRRWEANRAAFLARCNGPSASFTDAKASQVMETINSDMSSAVGLSLSHAIKLEYDNWLSEDWFPKKAELLDMKLDEVM